MNIKNKYTEIEEDYLNRFLIKYNEIRDLDGCITFNIINNNVLVDDVFFYKDDTLVTIDDKVITNAQALISELLKYLLETHESYRIKTAVFVFVSGDLSIAWVN